MIKNLISKIREKCYSLYVGLFANILIGVMAGIIIYAIVQLASDFYVRESYASPDRKLDREAETAEQLQDYASLGGLSSTDFAAIAEWDRENRYIYIMLYDGEGLVYTTDLGAVNPENTPVSSSEGYSGSGLTVDYPSFATLRRYAAQGQRYEISFADGSLFVSVAEISEYFYYDIINIIAIALALIVLSITVINCFRRTINRIRRLEADVTIVTHSDMEHRISAKGFDEISRLSSNVENMRHYILDNLRREREARESNTELITAMSHDIRTPLTVLLGYLEMMKGEAQNMPVLSEYIEASEKTAMRLKQLSDDMFKYSLAFGDATEGINLEEYDARMLFEQMLSEHVVLLKENGYEVVVRDLLDTMPFGATVMTDAQNLMRIVDNVFSNIYKYADIAEPIRITLGSLPGGRILFECVNTIRTDTYKAESNRIGLKTCRRLAGVIAESFDYGSSDGSFKCSLIMRCEAPEASADDGLASANAKKRGIADFIKDTAAALKARAAALIKTIKVKSQSILHPDSPEASNEQTPVELGSEDNLASAGAKVAADSVTVSDEPDVEVQSDEEYYDEPSLADGKSETALSEESEMLYDEEERNAETSEYAENEPELPEVEPEGAVTAELTESIAVAEQDGEHDELNDGGDGEEAPTEVKPIEIRVAESKTSEIRTQGEHRAVNIAKAIEPAKAEQQRPLDFAKEHRAELQRGVNIAKAIEQAPRGEYTNTEESQVAKND